MNDLSFETNLAVLLGDHPQWYLDGYPIFYIPNSSKIDGPATLDALNGEVRPNRMSRVWSGYIHVPFCVFPCSFCSLHKAPYAERVGRGYVEALKREMSLVSQLSSLRDVEIKGLSLGGGTPTALPVKELLEIILFFRDLFPCTDSFSCSVETSTRTCDMNYFKALVEGPVDRMSFGIQSFDERQRNWLGLRDSAGDASLKIQMARRAGVGNINIDMLYGLSDQTLEELNRDIDSALSLELESYTWYPLVVYPSPAAGSVLMKDVQQALPDTSLLGEMLDHVAARMEKAGYARLWLNQYVRSDDFKPPTILAIGSYLAFGSGAFGSLHSMNYFNEPDIERYIATVTSGLFPYASRTVMTEVHWAVRKFHYAFLRRRVDWNDFNEEERRVMQHILEPFASLGLWQDGRTCLKPTSKGEHFADAFLQALALRSVSKKVSDL